MNSTESGITPAVTALEAADQQWARAALRDELVCGADVAGRSAVLCFLPPEDPHAPVWIPISTRGAGLAGHRELALEASRAFASLQGVHTNTLWVERPFGKPHALEQLNRTIGVLAAAAPTWMAVDEISSAEWRKLLGIRQGAGVKRRVQEWAVAELAGRGSAQSMVWDSDHCADAYGIARAILESRDRFLRDAADATRKGAR